MAGDFNLPKEMSLSASRLKSNMTAIIEKYDRDFVDDDLISLSSMSVYTVSNKGTFNSLKRVHDFGTSKLKSTKRKDELLRTKLGQLGNVDLNVSRAIERRYVDALNDLDRASVKDVCDSDGETLSSFNEDDINNDDVDISGEKDEQSGGEADYSSNSDAASHDDNDIETEDIQEQDSSLNEDDEMVFVPSSDSDHSIEEEKQSDRKEQSRTPVKRWSWKGKHDDYHDLHRNQFDDQSVYVSNSKNVEQQYEDEVQNTTFSLNSLKLNRVNQQLRYSNHDVGNLTKDDHQDKFESISPRHAVKKIRDDCQRSHLQHKQVNNSPSLQMHAEPSPVLVSSNNVELSTIERKGKDDDVFKSPQGIRIKRVVPVRVGHISSSNPPTISTKLSSNTSGFSSFSSISKYRENSSTEYENCSRQNGYAQSEIQQRSCDIRTLNVLGSQHQPQNRLCMHNKNAYAVETNGSRVKRWVDTVKNQYTLPKQPLHYPSCPPKIPRPLKHHASQAISTSWQHVSLKQKSSDNYRDIGIQTTLNSSLNNFVKNSSMRKMKNVSTALSMSFLEAQATKSKLSEQTYSVDRHYPESYSVRHNLSCNNDEVGLMFPEEYVYQFSPLNPNRIDSDEVTNAHQNRRLRQGLKSSRPDLSFEVQSPKPKPSTALKNNFTANYTEKNVMFPEQYVYQFSPLNPNRIDSDEISNPLQNKLLRTCHKYLWPGVSEMENITLSENEQNTFCSSRPSQCGSFNDTFGSERSQSFAVLNSSWESVKHAYAVHSSTRSKDKHNRSYLDDFSLEKLQIIENNQHNQSLCNTSRASQTENVYKSSGHCSLKQSSSRMNNFIRASTPLHPEDSDDNDEIDFINSSSSNSVVMSGYRNEGRNVEHVPNLSVFLNSNPDRGHNSKNNDRNNNIMFDSRPLVSNRKANLLNEERHVGSWNCTPTPTMTRPKNSCSFQSLFGNSSFSRNSERKECFSYVPQSSWTSIRPRSYFMTIESENMQSIGMKSFGLKNSSSSSSSRGERIFDNNRGHGQEERLSISDMEDCGAMTNSERNSNDSKIKNIFSCASEVPHSPNKGKVDRDDIGASCSFIDAHTPRPKVSTSRQKILFANDNATNAELTVTNNCFHPPVDSPSVALIGRSLIKVTPKLQRSDRSKPLSCQKVAKQSDSFPHQIHNERSRSAFLNKESRVERRKYSDGCDKDSQKLSETKVAGGNRCHDHIVEDDFLESSIIGHTQSAKIIDNKVVPNNSYHVNPHDFVRKESNVNVINPDITISTIHGSDSEDEFENDFDGNSHVQVSPRPFLKNKGKENTQTLFHRPKIAPQKSMKSNSNSANCKSSLTVTDSKRVETCPTLFEKYIQSFHPKRGKRKMSYHNAGENKYLALSKSPDKPTRNGYLGNFVRASTPMRFAKSNKTSPQFDDTLSTIVGLQNKVDAVEVDDSEEEIDLGSQLLQDVDVLLL